MGNGSWFNTIKNVFMGGPRNVHDKTIFHRLSLIAFFAWIGLGADGLSSSCYGPQEAFLALNGHTYLSLFVALGTVLTIFVISASYSQIVELFPAGGGGYLVASKLLSPTLGMISGCALLIDYVLTIAVSVSSGADALFSFLPAPWYGYKLGFSIAVVLILMYLNMRGVKESVVPLMPIFLTFIATHVFIIMYAIARHVPNLPDLTASTISDTHATMSQVGFWGLLFLILKAYSMGAGTFTGIEAVSNGTPVLREPKVQTAKRTMHYMAISLSFMVLGLMIAYLLYSVKAQPGKTLNAILFEQVAGGWSGGKIFILIALISEATLLFVAAQTGFLDGPRVLANMATDRWFPTRFSSLSDRLVTQKGILIMAGLSAVLIMVTRASVQFLVVLYSINVFITFVLSQAGMVRHWWDNRGRVKKWAHKLLVNGIGLLLCLFILISMIVMKFNEGGWITMFITAALVVVALFTKKHYNTIGRKLRRLDDLVIAAQLQETVHSKNGGPPQLDKKAKTAVLLVNGFNGLGLHTLFGVIRLFGDTFRNFIFLEVGMVDAGNFKGAEEMGRLKEHVHDDVAKYVSFMNRQGYYAEGVPAIGVDLIDQVEEITPSIIQRFPNAVFFGGQLLFEKDSMMAPLFHNYAVFSIQKKLYRQGIPFVILPIRV
ncbi:MAG TPA: APC family permease [Candidatus Omnitrophota bacterium]|nr:APC family permease [Candidatus Omnitrophota bacterium]